MLYVITILLWISKDNYLNEIYSLAGENAYVRGFNDIYIRLLRIHYLIIPLRQMVSGSDALIGGGKPVARWQRGRPRTLRRQRESDENERERTRPEH